MAYVDLQNLLAGQPTPVLTPHMVMALIIYPVFGVLFGGFIIAAARDRALGSIWIAPVGILGALAHGAAGLLTIGFGIPWAGIGFPLFMLVMIWGLPRHVHARACAGGGTCAGGGVTPWRSSARTCCCTPPSPRSCAAMLRDVFGLEHVDAGEGARRRERTRRDPAGIIRSRAAPQSCWRSE